MDEDPEIRAMSSLKDALTGLDEQAITRVLRWAADRYGIAVVPKKSIGPQGLAEPKEETAEDKKFGDISSLYDAANPTSDAEKALVVAYWFQEVQGQESFEAFRVNTQLKHLGHGLKNVTKALDSLKNRSPRLVIQTQKSGSAKQARKKYKVTAEGIRKVKQMLAGKPADEE